jgi:hypothetical protein
VLTRNNTLCDALSTPNITAWETNMPNTVWTSEPIHLTREVSVDVRATTEGVVLGEAANHVFASDLILTAAAAKALAAALNEAADKAIDASGGAL